MIPRVFHRVWLDEPIPDEFEAYWDGFRAQHPGWEFRTWDRTEELRDWMICSDEFDAATTHAGRSDVARYEILARYGGVYVDTDVECLRSFDDLTLSDKPFAGWEDGNMICPTVMGAPPGHPAMLAILGALPRWVAHRPGQPPNRQTGPYLLTHTWRGRPDVRLLPPVAFYPVHWSEKTKLGGEYPDGSYAVHHWAASWLPAGPPQRARL